MAPMRVRFLPLLVACALLTPGGLALAANNSSDIGSNVRESNSTHVIGFAAGDNLEQADALTRSLKKVLELSSNQKLGSGDFSLEVLTAALGCPDKPDATCLKKIATKISSKRYLWGTIDLEGQRVEVELHLFAEDASDKKFKFSYQASLKDSMDGDFLGIAANGLGQLLGPLRYRVVVRSTQNRGMVFVDGKEAGPLVNGEATLELPVGDHQFSLKPLPATSSEQGTGSKSGTDNAIATQSVRVQVSELTKVRLDPTKTESGGAPVVAKGAGQENASKPAKPAPEAFPEQEHKSSNAQRTWGYISLASGGALLAGGVATAAGLYLLNHKENFQRYREGLQPNQNACSEASRNRVVPGAMTPDGVQSLCSTASTLEVAQIVLFAGGIVAAGTGLTLLLTSKPNTQTAQQTIVPTLHFGRGHGDVSVVVRF